MKVTYICHSGFLVETANCYYLFDYYKGGLPSLDMGKPILVFASHRHPDHYNPEVFRHLQKQGMQQILAILSKDIPARNYPEGVEVQKVTCHTTYQLPCDTTLETLLSTDEGVAFLLKCPEGILYHAGDLNDWTWEGESDQDNRQMTGNYRHEINMIQNTPVDIAFVPLDPRQEADYAKGMLYFLEKVPAKKVYPMHYWGKHQVIRRFLEEHPEYNGIIQDTEAANATE